MSALLGGLRAAGLEGRSTTFAPSFEEQLKDDVAVGFIWRNSAVVAALSKGDLSVTSHDGTQVHIRFGGANQKHGPHGESPTMRRTFYLLGPRETWRTNSHFERVRYPE